MVKRELEKPGLDRVLGVDCLIFDDIMCHFYLVDHSIAIGLPPSSTKLQGFEDTPLKTHRIIKSSRKERAGSLKTVLDHKYLTLNNGQAAIVGPLHSSTSINHELVQLGIDVARHD
ncbi:hypothetical protein K3495_g5548 [Podosphaera aphanis]|nr:hypothetical protein K3495_g5548 [Podosphaera aphanis]